jgi:type II secretory ATPase GspE/PulE/Tfp pilus assembly ATPase PilB-like protein
MVIDQELKRLINANASETEIRVYLRKTSWRTLREKALDVVDRSDSTLEEVLRVTRSEGVQASDPSGTPAAEEVLV